METILLRSDLSSTAGLDSLRDQVEEGGIKLGGLVNNAGIAVSGDVRNITDEDWGMVLSLNLTAPVLLTKRLLKFFTDSSSILNMSSASGLRASREISIAYQSSKAALIHATKSMALSLAPKTRVNAIAPSFVETHMTGNILSNSGFREVIVRMTPMGRMETIEDVTNMASFLLSEKSSFITGQTFLIDGGITL